MYSAIEITNGKRVRMSCASIGRGRFTFSTRCLLPRWTSVFLVLGARIPTAIPVLSCRWRCQLRTCPPAKIIFIHLFLIFIFIMQVKRSYLLALAKIPVEAFVDDAVLRPACVVTIRTPLLSLSNARFNHVQFLGQSLAFVESGALARDFQIVDLLFQILQLLLHLLRLQYQPVEKRLVGDFLFLGGKIFSTHSLDTQVSCKCHVSGNIPAGVPLFTRCAPFSPISKAYAGIEKIL